ncbi:hypothetical protein WOLCODRAFT_148510 [Wolfiporia cocos MD-104 SS10]|uniref:Uncharacterized protein n=1 Tax=Wolfiporia cocos (strain MD-104) TaxID=742152 RepID=A0A2H3IXL1_WOLCO|nr:hypothetical protein WOLCODRAFT_148510 [Wolfiporia cocos MD-104 SS10]
MNQKPESMVPPCYRHLADIINARPPPPAPVPPRLARISPSSPPPARAHPPSPPRLRCLRPC